MLQLLSYSLACTFFSVCSDAFQLDLAFQEGLHSLSTSPRHPAKEKNDDVAEARRRRRATPPKSTAAVAPSRLHVADDDGLIRTVIDHNSHDEARSAEVDEGQSAEIDEVPSAEDGIVLLRRRRSRSRAKDAAKGEEPVLIISGVTSDANGRAVDLIVSNASEYLMGQSEGNVSSTPSLAVVNLERGTSVDLNFRLVDQETYTPVTLESFALSFLSMDVGANGTSAKKVIASDFAAYFVSKNSSIDMRRLPGDHVSFSASTPNTDGLLDDAGTDQQLDPLNLSASETDHSFALVYKHASIFQLSVQLSSGDSAGQFLLTGVSSVIKYSLPRPASSVGVTEYQCASDGSRKHDVNCPECTMEKSCACDGFVTFGYPPYWSAWRKISGEIDCSIHTFGDPFPGHGKMCMCRPGDDVQPESTKAARLDVIPSTIAWILWPTAAVITTCLSVFTVLNFVRIRGEITGQQPGPLERALDSAVPAVVFAPMLCAIFLVVAKRTWTMTAGQPDLYDDYPCSAVQVAIVACAIAFCAQAYLRVYAERLAAQEGSCATGANAAALAATGGSPDSVNSTHAAMQFCLELFHVAVVVMYSTLALVIYDLWQAPVPEPVRLQRELLGLDPAPLPTGSACAVALAVVYFSVYVMQHIVSYVAYSAFNAAVVKQGAVAVNFAPMACLLFLGVQVAADWDRTVVDGLLASEGPAASPAAWGELPTEAESLMQLSVGAVFIQVAFAMVPPLLPAWLPFAGADMLAGPRIGEEFLVMRSHLCAACISGVGFCVMLLVLSCVFNICHTLIIMKTTSTNAYLLSLLAGTYFSVHALRWAALTAWQLRGKAFASTLGTLTTAKEAVAVCPILAAVLLTSWTFSACRGDVKELTILGMPALW